MVGDDILCLLSLAIWVLLCGLRSAPGCSTQLDEQSGARTRWSAPLFFTVNAAGAGATLGVSEIASVLVLDTPQACDAFLRTQARCCRWHCLLCPCRQQLREQLCLLQHRLEKRATNQWLC